MRISLSRRSLAGRRAIVTSGPTFEAIDPVRFIANRSSGKQGHAIATALAELGASTVLVTGPSSESDPPNVDVIRIESARQMLDACVAALPADIAVCAAAVSDWRPSESRASKLKKTTNGAPQLQLVENPDILGTLSEPGSNRPEIVVGFAAETDDLVEHATAKLARKGCDWILANDVSPESRVFGGDTNNIRLISAGGIEEWPEMSKIEVARRLAERISSSLSDNDGPRP